MPVEMFTKMHTENVMTDINKTLYILAEKQIRQYYGNKNIVNKIFAGIVQFRPDVSRRDKTENY